MSTVLALPLAIALLASALAVAAIRRRAVQRAVSLTASAAVLGCAVALLAATGDGEVVAVAVGGFPGPVAINLVADTLSALMLSMTGLLVLVGTAYAVAVGLDRDHPAFHPMVQALTAGVALAFLTADLFNLFVAFEVLLIASYVLAVVGVGPTGRRSAFTYVTVNLVGSALLLAGTGLVYALAGTVNLGALAARADTPGLLVPLSLVLAAFAIKSALVPVHGWLPSTYVNMHPAVSALFSGLLTKVGIYALYRTVPLLLPDDDRVLGALVLVAGVTMAVGVMGAVGQYTMRSILAFHMTSQVGYLLLGVGLLTGASLSAGIAYTVQYMAVKTALFLVAAALIHAYGTDRISELGGLARRRPGLAVAFGIAAAALGGLPPLSGFVPKVGLVFAAFDVGAWVVGGVALAVSLFTLLSMLKIWVAVFWDRTPEGLVDRTVVPVPAGGAGNGHGDPERDGPPETHDGPEGTGHVDRGLRARVAAPALVLAGVAVALGIGAGPLLERAEVAAEQLLDRDAYIEAVTEGTP